MQHPWAESHFGGSAEREEAEFARLAERVRLLQRANAERAHGVALRTLHAKPILGHASARFRVLDEIPAIYRQGPFRPGQEFEAFVRLSNASGVPQPDRAGDMRGMAIRLNLPEGGMLDFLMTNFPVSHARDAHQFVRFAEIAAGARPLLLPRMLMSFGPRETARILKNLVAATRRPVTSIAQESFWSRGALLWGEAGPVRYSVRPFPTKPPPLPPVETPDLRREICERIARDDVSFEFCLQPFINEALTPIEDGAADWKVSDASLLPVAIVTLPRCDALGDAHRSGEAMIEALAFNPWNSLPGFRPLGNLNRARKAVYRASAEGRGVR